MSRQRIIVIGAGAAGLMAAGQAAATGAEVLVLEKKKRPGRKLAITGKGRCNITNEAQLEEFLASFGKTGDFLRPCFSQFDNNDLMDFFEKSGLELVKERGGRVFPKSSEANDVVDVLLRWVEGNGAYLKYNTAVDKLLVRRGKLTAVICRGRKYACSAAIIATGGASYPATGSTGDGYRITAALRHTIVPIRPALVPLTIDKALAKMLAGVSLRNTKVRLLVDGEERDDAFGELEINHRGLTGPVILTLSGQVVDAIDKNSKVALVLDLKPALNEATLDRRISRDLIKRGAERFNSFLRGLLPKQLVNACLAEIGVAENRLAKSISEAERVKLGDWLKNFRIEVEGYRSIGEAIVTAGGVSTDEVDPQTMQSRLVEGLYIAGELLDVDAATGGYNLQAAFSTGWVAGKAAAAAIAISEENSTIPVAPANTRKSDR